MSQLGCGCFFRMVDNEVVAKTDRGLPEPWRKAQVTALLRTLGTRWGVQRSIAKRGRCTP